RPAHRAARSVARAARHDRADSGRHPRSRTVRAEGARDVLRRGAPLVRRLRRTSGLIGSLSVTDNAVRADRTWMVALAASLWGTSALMREPLTRDFGVPSATVVFAEHLVLVLILSPWLAGALRALRAASVRTIVAIVIIGAGSSALATTLFTAAFAIGDPITPQALQKLQPLIAMLLAVVILRERIRPVFWLFAGPA